MGNETQHMQASIQVTHRHKSTLRVNETDILDNVGAAPIKIRRPRERELALADIPRILGGIETDVHGINVYAYIQKCKSSRAAQNPLYWVTHARVSKRLLFACMDPVDPQALGNKLQILSG